MTKRILPILAAAVVLTPMFFMHSCANTTEAPTGGLKDTIPPFMVAITPEPGTTGVPTKGAKLIFSFSEYVTLKAPRNIFLSPPQQKPVKAKLSGRNVIVTFEEPLDSNTTYTLSFTDAIADANEGNMFPGFTYVFSTGERIDSMMVTGTVRDCNTLEPFKGATVLLYKDLTDSAVFLHRPYAATKTDAWGFFRLPYIADTVYRIYAIKDDTGNNIYDPESDLIAFCDSLIRPVYKTNDTIPEMLNYEMSDTLSCRARRSEHELNLFREKPTKQYIKNTVRVADRFAYITFMAPNAWIDTMWVGGVGKNQLITEFNIKQDSLLIWVNSRKAVPDTLHLFVNYRKTDSLGVLKPELEHVKLFEENASKKKARNTYQAKKSLKHEDTICVYKVVAPPEKVEQDGFSIEFEYPIITEHFDSVVLKSINPRQKENYEKFSIEKDTLNLRRYILRPQFKFQTGYEYVLKVPEKAFRDINGFYCDSLELKVSLPTDDDLSTLTLEMTGVDRKLIIDLLNQSNSLQRSYVIDKDCSLNFPYLKADKYAIRMTEDKNRNSIVDEGALLEHRQPEKVVFYTSKGNKYIDIPEGSETLQSIDIKSFFD